MIPIPGAKATGKLANNPIKIVVNPAAIAVAAKIAPGVAPGIPPSIKPLTGRM